jgi:hypothetical protein
MKTQTKIKLMNYSTVALVTIALLTPFVYDGIYNKVTTKPLTSGGTTGNHGSVALAALPNTLEISEGQYNALRITKHLLKTSNMSKGELLSTLEGKGFSLDDATYALDTIKPNWGIRAQYTAIEILEVNTLPLTKEELYIQLTGEYGFTAIEANEGISYIDYPAYLNMKRGIKQ